VSGVFGVFAPEAIGGHVALGVLVADALKIFVLRFLEAVGIDEGIAAGVIWRVNID